MHIEAFFCFFFFSVFASPFSPVHTRLHISLPVTLKCALKKKKKTIIGNKKMIIIIRLAGLDGFWVLFCRSTSCMFFKSFRHRAGQKLFSVIRKHRACPLTHTRFFHYFKQKATILIDVVCLWGNLSGIQSARWETSMLERMQETHTRWVCTGVVISGDRTSTYTQACFDVNAQRCRPAIILSHKHSSTPA